ncbi:sialate O-acetylesterase [Lactococcus allomyrinae]|uniref:9-O-acetylesterase n=1 Tax=Lactococcus allomyrinae TaxID=2419773 RepID=A0A387BFV3_9LACT|nr:sialate O-acetylesterase [Lactococcus allomyrinae]AYG00006.1 9-O-acetylesterase [Lactococcus allomyrinae]
MKTSLFIPYLLRDGAILQRNVINHFWGYTASNKRISLTYENFFEKVSADKHGYFIFKLPPHEASSNLDFTIQIDCEKWVIRAISFGDVFLLSGQSNMQLPMERLKMIYPDEVSKANNSHIHFFEVPESPIFKEKREELESGVWHKAIGEDLKRLSGIAYFFAKEKYKKDGIPIGLILAAVGGSPINSWMSELTLKTLNSLPIYYSSLKDETFLKYRTTLDEGYQTAYQKMCEQTDKGLLENWKAVTFDDSDWEEAELNKQWLQKYRTPGCIWLRKKIVLPKAFVGKTAQLYLGTMKDADEVFINGKLVGNTEYQYPPRIYELTELSSVLTIVIRLKIYQSLGGITLTKNHCLLTETQSLDLDNFGHWKIKRGNHLPERAPQYFPQWETTGLFNGMIAPLKHTRFSAILWYQGESDTVSANNYGLRFCKLIQEWRQIFSDSELPFLFVQLPNYALEPENDWARLREEQKAALVLDKTAMVVSVGDGEDDDLHPLNKEIIAKHLFQSYQKIKKYPQGYCNGPLASQAYQYKDQIVIEFQTFGKHLKINHQLELELVENEKVYQLTDIELSENEVRIRLPSILKVTHTSLVRYNWTNHPKPFITDDAGNAASPFELKIS